MWSRNNNIFSHMWGLTHNICIYVNKYTYGYIITCCKERKKR